MYAKILVPVDGSESSKLGLLEAIKIAKQNGSELRLVHIVNELVLDYALSTSLYSAELIEGLRNNGKQILAQSESLAKQNGITPQTVLVEAIGGPAANHIIINANEWPADLIVMGTHGRRGLKRLTMGSDAELVVRSTRAPVLLVRQAENHD